MFLFLTLLKWRWHVNSYKVGIGSAPELLIFICLVFFQSIRIIPSCWFLLLILWFRLWLMRCFRFQPESKIQALLPVATNKIKVSDGNYTMNDSLKNQIQQYLEKEVSKQLQVFSLSDSHILSSIKSFWTMQEQYATSGLYFGGRCDPSAVIHG